MTLYHILQTIYFVVASTVNYITLDGICCIYSIFVITVGKWEWEKNIFVTCYHIKIKYVINIQDLDGAHLLVQQTVHDEEEGALLGVEQYEEHLEEEVGLVQTQDPSAAQDDKLGQDLEHDQPAKKFNRGTAKLIRDGTDRQKERYTDRTDRQIRF